jgi:hypothetical protein
MFFSNRLIAYDPKVYENLMSTLSALDVFVTKKIPFAMTHYEYTMYSGSGKAHYGNGRSGKESTSPHVNITAESSMLKLEELSSALMFSRVDLAASEYTQSDLVFNLKRQAFRCNMEAINNTCFFGNKEVGLSGLLDNKFITGINAEAPVTNDWTLSTTSSTSIHDDLTKALGVIVESTNSLMPPNMMLCSPAVYHILDKRIFNTYMGATIRNQFEAANNLTVKMCPELKGAFTGGKNGFVLLNNLPDNIEHIVSEEFTVLPLEAIGSYFQTICTSTHGGLVIRQPASICIRTMLNA